MKFKIFLFIILFINIFSINTYSQSKDTDDVIRIVLYETEPYYSIDSDGNVRGTIMSFYFYCKKSISLNMNMYQMILKME